MSEPGSLYRLSVLEERWRSDRSPRVFLQLADELRRANRTGRAIEVLRDGLKWHPESVSGWVALGRILLDEDDSAAAIAALDQAIERDPAQLVANQLLTEAWIRLGDAERAAESLERSRLLSLPEAEIERLEAEIRTLTSAGSVAAEEAETKAAAALPQPFDLPAPAELPPIDLGQAGPGRRGWVRVEVAGEPFASLLETGTEAVGLQEQRLRLEGIFAAPPGDARAEAEPPRMNDVAVSESVALAEAVEPAAAPVPPGPPIAPQELAPPEVGAAAAEAAVEEEAAPAPVLPIEPVFEPLSIGEEVEREAEGTIPLPEVAAEALAEAPAELAAEPMVEPGFIPVEPEEAAAGVAPEAWEVMPEPEAEQPEPVPAATSTLAALYLSQGHLDEAEAEYRRVLAIRPEDENAAAGLSAVAEQRRRAEEAAAPVVSIAPSPAGLTARKLLRLRGLYLSLRTRRLERRASVS